MEVEVDTWTLDSGWKERGGPNTCAWAMGCFTFCWATCTDHLASWGTASMQFAVLQQ